MHPDDYSSPTQLTFDNVTDAHNFVSAMLKANEQVIWQQRALETGIVVVEILGINNLERELEDQDDMGST